MQIAQTAFREATPSEQPRDAKLVRSAHEFEASLMAELLRPLQEGDGLTGEESDLGGEGSGGALSGFAAQSLARAISERGGFGIADRILDRFAAAPHGREGRSLPTRGETQGFR